MYLVIDFKDELIWVLILEIWSDLGVSYRDLE